mgnify:CR=1 FL=1
MKLKEKKNKNDWEKAYNYAKNKYGAGQNLLDVPARKGKMSFTYTNNMNLTICTYYY